MERRHTGLFTAGTRAHSAWLEHKDINERDVDLKRRAVNLQRLPFGDIVFRMQELLVLCENLLADWRKLS